MAFPSKPSIGQKYTAVVQFTAAELATAGIVSGLASGQIAKLIKPIFQKKLTAALGSAASKLFTPILIACEAAGFYGILLQGLNKNGVKVTMGFEYKRIQLCQQGACIWNNDWVLDEGLRVYTY